MYDVPTEVRRIGKSDRTRVDVMAMCQLARDLVWLRPQRIICEHVQAGGKENASSAATLVEAATVICVAFAAAGMNPERKAPVAWQNAMRVPVKRRPDGRRDKEPSRELAKQLFPDAAEMFKRVKDGDRAEAALIAEFARRTDSVA